MICSARELGLGEDHDGIIVLQEWFEGDEEVLGALKPGDDAISLLGLEDEVVEVTITPDRGYCFSLRGIAREYGHATGGAFRDPAGLTVEQGDGPGYPVEVADEAPLLGRVGCDRYVARVIRGVDASRPSPHWMQKRLTQSGMRPISLAVDITNYVMLALGQPLHAFDVSGLSGSIVVRRARPGEQLTTLDDVRRTLFPEDLLITDGGQAPLAIAGVMGGAASEVTDATTDILVESAHFDPTTVARSSRRHKLVTEASKRYERGVDVDLAAAAAQLAVNLLQELGGGVPDAGVTDVDLRRPRTPVRLDPSLPARLVGLPWSAQDGRRHAARDRLRGRRHRRRRPHRAAAQLAPRPAGRRRLRRGGRPPAWLRPDPVRAAPGPRRPGADPRPAGTPCGRHHAGPPRLRRGAHLPLRRARRCTTSSGWRPTTRGAPPCAWPTRCPRRRR